MQSPRPQAKILLVGPLPIPGHYAGGISVMLTRMIELWSLPFELIICNTNTVAREYASVNKLNRTNVCRVFRNLRDIVALARKERPTLIYFHTSRHFALLKDCVLMGLAKRFCPCRVLAHVHHASSRTLFAGSSRIGRRWQLRLMNAAFDHLLLMCDSIRRELFELTPPSARPQFEEKVSVLYNFTPLREPVIKPLHSGDERLTLFFIGNVGPAKGIPELILAAAKLRDQATKVQVVAAGPFDSREHEQEYRNLALSLGIADQVKFTGPVVEPVKSELFQAADIFVLPSHAEGVPIAMLEAMAFGLPVVASAVGGIPELLESSGAGLLVPARNVDELARAVQQLAESPDLRARMGQAGRRAVEIQHSPAAFFHGLCEVLSKAIGADSPGRTEAAAATVAFNR